MEYSIIVVLIIFSDQKIYWYITGKCNFMYNHQSVYNANRNTKIDRWTIGTTPMLNTSQAL